MGLDRLEIQLELDLSHKITFHVYIEDFKTTYLPFGVKNRLRCGPRSLPGPPPHKESDFVCEHHPLELSTRPVIASR